MAGMQPKTVALIQQADEAKDDTERQKREREAVHAFFAESAPYWTEDMVMAWQRNNPVGSKFLCEFGRVMEAPERELDPINYELALNWLRRGYNLMTENELSEAIFKATGQHVKPNTLKKKRAKSSAVKRVARSGHGTNDGIVNGVGHRRLRAVPHSFQFQIHALDLARERNFSPKNSVEGRKTVQGVSPRSFLQDVLPVAGNQLKRQEMKGKLRYASKSISH